MELSQWRSLTRHPLSAAWPDMDGAEFDAMCADMAKLGYDQKQQVWLYEGKVLDGWHRLRAAVTTNKVPTFDTFKGDTEQAELFVIRRNLNRRHLDTSQRGLMAGRFAKGSHGGDRRGQVSLRTIDKESKTIGELAENFKVSEQTVRRGKAVDEHGDDDLQDAVMQKEIALTDAAAIVAEPKPKQRRAVKAVKSGAAKTAKEAIEQFNADEDEVVDEINRPERRDFSASPCDFLRD